MSDEAMYDQYDGPTEDQVNDWNIHNDHADAIPPEDDRWLGWLCEHCGAEPGEPCKPDCTFAETADEAQAEQPLLEQAAGALMGVVYRLPYSGLLDDPPSRKDIDHDLWLAKLAVWMEKYRALLTEMVAQLEAGNRRAVALQLEKDVVRGFLTGTGGGA